MSLDLKKDILEAARHYQTEEFDRRTALRVLQDISSNMYPSSDIFGTKTLIITRYDFEKIRQKYLDKKE